MIVDYIECECNMEAIRLEYDKIFDPESIFLAIYSVGVSKQKWTLKEKLRHIFFILKNGHPYRDEIILNKEEAIKFRDSLNKIIKESSKN